MKFLERPLAVDSLSTGNSVSNQAADTALHEDNENENELVMTIMKQQRAAVTENTAGTFINTTATAVADPNRCCGSNTSALVSEDAVEYRMNYQAVNRNNMGGNDNENENELVMTVIKQRASAVESTTVSTSTTATTIAVAELPPNSKMSPFVSDQEEEGKKERSPPGRSPSADNLEQAGGHCIGETDDILANVASAPNLRRQQVIQPPMLHGAFAVRSGELTRRPPLLGDNLDGLDESDYHEWSPAAGEGLHGTSGIHNQIADHDNNTRLAQALPVQDEEHQISAVAQLHYPPPPALASAKHNMMAAKRKRLILLATLVALLVAILVPTLIVTLRTKKNDDAISINATEMEQTFREQASTPLWTPGIIHLPDYTLANMNDVDSPQFQAYQWLAADPDLLRYTETRKVQRFALATLYYATKGDSWYTQTNWTTYGTHECYDWYNQALLLPPRGFEPCDDEEEYKALALHENNLKGTLPPELGLLSNLEVLFVTDNVLVGTLPPQVWSLPLRVLILKSNYLTGTLEPWALKKIQNTMIWLDIHDNSFEATLPSELGLLSKCSHLGLNDNFFTGTIPPTIGMMSNLSQLALSANQLTGSIPAEAFLRWGKLTHLELRDNSLLSGTVPTEIGLATSLEYLYLYGCQLTGGIPSEVGLLANLKDLVISDNYLSQTIPDQLWKLDMLRDFYLGCNDFTGTLSSEIRNLKQLKRLNAQVTLLQGSIPSDIGLLTSLTYLGLGASRFSGTLPLQILSLSSLTYYSIDETVSLNAIPGTATTTVDDSICSRK